MTASTNNKLVGLRINSLTHSARKSRGQMTHIHGIWYVTPWRLCGKVPGSLEKRKLESKLDEAQQEDPKKKDLPLADDNDDGESFNESLIFFSVSWTHQCPCKRLFLWKYCYSNKLRQKPPWYVVDDSYNVPQPWVIRNLIVSWHNEESN